MNEITPVYVDPPDHRKTTHRLSLMVETGDVEEWSHVHNLMSRMATEWGPYHELVAVSSVMLNDDGVAMVSDGDEFHNEGTMDKVYNALAKIGLTPQQIAHAINEMQNQGILFRERS